MPPRKKLTDAEKEEAFNKWKEESPEFAAVKEYQKAREMFKKRLELSIIDMT